MEVMVRWVGYNITEIKNITEMRQRRQSEGESGKVSPTLENRLCPVIIILISVIVKNIEYLAIIDS